MELMKLCLTAAAQITILSALSGVAQSQVREIEKSESQSFQMPPTLPRELLLTDEERSTPIRSLGDLPELFREEVSVARCDNDRFSDAATAQLIVTKLARMGGGKKIFAIMPCFHGVMGRLDMLYVYTKNRRAAAISFPTLDHQANLMATYHPGALKFNSELGTITSTIGSDMLPNFMYRHHYKFDHSDDAVKLVRIERRLRTGATYDGNDWETIWKTAQWGDVDSPSRQPTSP